MDVLFILMLLACFLAWVLWPLILKPVPKDLSIRCCDGTVYTVVTDGKRYAVSWETPSGVTSVFSDSYQTEKQARKWMHHHADYVDESTEHQDRDWRPVES